MINWFDSNENDNLTIKPVPGFGLQIPVWLLGSSSGGADIASQLGLPFVYAAHLVPDTSFKVIDYYRVNFKPSKRHCKPYVMVCVNVVAAETEHTARYLFMQYLHQYCNFPKPQQMDYLTDEWHPSNLYNGKTRKIGVTIVGDKNKIAKELKTLLKKTDVDEVMINSPVIDKQSRLLSYQLIMEAYYSIWNNGGEV